MPGRLQRHTLVPTLESLHERVRDLELRSGVRASATRRLVPASRSSRAATVVVAAADSSSDGRAAADFVCDGTADDVEVNQAIQQVDDNGPGRGRVLCLEGTYTLEDGLLGEAGVDLFGLGAGTVFLIPAGYAGAANYPLTPGSDSTWADFRVENQSPAVYGLVQVNGTATILHRLRLDSFTEDFIEGVEFNAASECALLNSFLFNLSTFLNGPGDCLVQGNVFDESGDLAALTLVSIGGVPTKRALILGNRFVNAAQEAIKLSNAEDCLVQGNLAVASGRKTNNTYDAIAVTGGARNALLANMARKGASGNQARYGMNIAGGGAVDTFATDNDLKNSGVTGNFNDTGTGTITAAGNRT